jgi:prepilin-type N-terminal cleavage/methylation domain-containing protein
MDRRGFMIMHQIPAFAGMTRVSANVRLTAYVSIAYSRYRTIIILIRFCPTKEVRRIMKKIQKGFTLVELLIVIALLGALAIGLIGALDPFEQLKKGTDTGTRNTVSEIHSAIIRYYALKGYMPWCDEAGVCAAISGAPLNDGTEADPGPMSLALDNIVATGELKASFTTLQSGELAKVFVTGDNVNAIVCFQPTSKSFRADKNTKFDNLGVVKVAPAVCDTTDLNACYWCVQ